MINPADIGERSSEDCSDGETSDDLATRFPSYTTGNTTVEAPKNPIPPASQGLQDLLAKIDTEVSEKSKLTTLVRITDQDYYIDQLNKPFLYINSAMIEPIQSVILVTTKTYEFLEFQSDYLQETPIIFGWQNIYQMQASDISANLQLCYRTLYLELRQHILFTYILGLSQAKIDTITKIRKDCPRGRQMFHYIGFQFPPISNKGISFYPLCSTNVLSFETLFNIISPPSCFLFDCDNAGIVIPILEDASKHYITATPRKGDTPGVNDWFCFCATSPGEELPINPYLPRDFLSQCILNPVPLVILCHILNNFKTSFPTDNFPMNILNDLLLNGPKCEKERTRIESILLAVVDAIASDNLQPFMFKQIFRRDRTTSRMFEHFIVAQYLLHFYGIHPLSHPRLPYIATHHLWGSLETELSSYVAMKISGRPRNELDFFSRIVTSFENSMEHLPINQTLLSLMCHAPFSGCPEASKSVILISQLAARSQANRNMLSKVSIFHAFFARLVSSLTNEELHSIAYIVVSLLQCDPNSVFDIRHDLDISALPGALFNRDVPCETRSLIAAILAAVLDTVKAVEAFCSTADFFDSLTKELQVASPQLQLWLLILVKRVFGSFPAISGSFTPSGAHLQIAACLNHRSPEVRASAIASLTAFIGERGQASALVYLSAPLLFDMSFVVRYEFAQFLCRFFELQSIQSKRYSKIKYPKHMSQLIDSIVGKHIDLSRTKESFIQYVQAADEAISAPTNDDTLIAALTVYADILDSDPHPSVKQAGHRLAKALFEGGEMTDGDTDALFNISLRQLVNSGQWKVENDKDDDKQFHKVNFTEGDVPACSAHQLLCAKMNDIVPNRIAFEQSKYSLAIAAPSKTIVRLDEGLRQFGRLSCSDSIITDLRTADWNGGTRIFVASSDGCVNVWEGTHHECSLSFRASLLYNDESTNQIIAPARQFHRITSSTSQGGVVLWDVDCMQFAGEWSGETRTMTALEVAASDDTTVFAGFEDGAMSILDTRVPSMMTATNPNYNAGAIVKITSSLAPGVIVNTMSKTGVFTSWDLRVLQPTTHVSINTTVELCDMHPCYALAISVPQTGPPVITNGEGKVLCVIPEMKNVSSVAMHPLLPIFACSTNSGDVVSYQLAFSYN